MCRKLVLLDAELRKYIDNTAYIPKYQFWCVRHTLAERCMDIVPRCDPTPDATRGLHTLILNNVLVRWSKISKKVLGQVAYC